MSEQKRKCSMMTSEGHKCKSWALKGKDYCFIHQPDKEKVIKAQTNGGKKGKRKPKALASVAYIQDVREILEEQINNVRNSSESDISIAKTVGNLVSILLRYFEVMRDIRGNGEILKPKESEIAREKRQGIVKEALSELPEDIRDEVVKKIEGKKQEMMIWLSKELQKAENEVNKREEHLKAVSLN